MPSDSTFRATLAQTSDPLVCLLADLSASHFYGLLEIKFESGRVALVRKTETLKLPDCRDTRGSEHAPH